MKPFMMSAVLKRTVLDTISFQVRASSEDHAYEMAKRALEDYPGTLERHAKSIPMLVTENRESLDSELIDLEIDSPEKDYGEESA